MATSAGSVMPAELLRAVQGLATEVRSKLQELYAKVPFRELQLDSFDANHGTLTVDLLPTFQAHVEQEAKRVADSAREAKARRDAGGGAKRSRMSFLPQSVKGLAGLSRGGPVAGMVTPDKRRSAAGLGAVGDMLAETPPRVARPVRVTLKSSMNHGLDVKPEPMTTDFAVEVQVLGDPALWSGPRRGTYAWMDESVEDCASERDQHLATFEPLLAEAMQQRHAGENLVVGTLGEPSQSETILCGRIVCEGLEGRLNERSMLLEGSQALTRGARVQLNASACPTLAAFPGQLVSVLGRSGLAGTTFHARDILAGLPVAPVGEAAGALPLHLLTLAGPFCLRGGLDYTPLEQALEHAALIKPQVVLLVGPLVDASNAKVAEGDWELPSDEGEPCSIEEFYTQHVLAILLRGLQALRRASPSSRVLYVPSLDEALSFHPLPQPPLDVELAPLLGDAGRSKLEQLKRLGLQCLPNPSHLDINGVRVSVTSADALSPVLRSGMVLRPEERKIEQALRLLQQQRSLFPVLPREPARVAESRAAALDFPERFVPDVCIFPSMSGTPSGMLVDGRLFVNPGSVCRPAAPGTFAELWAGGSAKGPSEKAAMRDRVRVDIQSLAA